MRKSSIIVISLLGASLFGCGGGGTENGAATPETTPPFIRATVPGISLTGVPPNAAVSAIFSERMNPSTITTGTFILKDNAGNGIPGSVGYNGTTATFTPSVNLSDNLQYSATVTTGVKDLAGNAMTADRSWSFTTGILTTTVRFELNIQPIFSNNCLIGCHIPGGQGPFDLRDGEAYSNLLVTRVIPGNSAGSTLFGRISGAIEPPMPLPPRLPLSQADQAAIKTWIDEGAYNN